MSLSGVILAAGQGTRMKSDLPKVLHAVGGRPMLRWVIEAVKQAGIPRPVVVIGHGAELVRPVVEDAEIALQEQQLGTAHALLQARPHLPPTGRVLVVCGDTPLLRGETLRRLVDYHEKGGFVATVLTVMMPNPQGYGRIVREGEDGPILRIVEEKDATEEERRIREVNTGIYVFELEKLWPALEKVRPLNAQGEYYLTDALGILRQEGAKIGGLACLDPAEVQGVNSRVQLAAVEAEMRRRKNQALMENGVTILDPGVTYIDQEVEVGRDTIIYPFTFLEGSTRIGSGCIIGPQCRIVDSTIGNNVRVQYSLLYEATVADDVWIGPFAYLRPETRVEEGAKIGDFVELKKATIGKGSKVPHHSYIGDATVGAGVNIGAGTITCNYDGREKHPTFIEDGAFIGSNANLVAPVRVGQGAYVAAGSTITKDVPPGALGIGRARQINLEDWVAKRRSEEEK